MQASLLNNADTKICNETHEQHLKLFIHGMRSCLTAEIWWFITMLYVYIYKQFY